MQHNYAHEEMVDFNILADTMKNKFVVFDGPDGSGKSTAMANVTKALTTAELKLDIVRVREPGGTDYGEKIREVIQHWKPPSGEPLDETAEMLLFMAARLQLMNRVVIPALKAGKTVFADRWVSSTLAYQGAGLGISKDLILDAHRIAIPERYWPDLTLLFDVPDTTARERISKGRDDKDKIEDRDDLFRRQVRYGYLQQAVWYPNHTMLVDASGPEQHVECEALKSLVFFFNQLGEHSPVW